MAIHWPDFFRIVVRFIVFCIIAVVFWNTLPFLGIAFNFGEFFTLEKWNEIVYLLVLLSIGALIFCAPAIIVGLLVLFGKLAKGVSGYTTDELSRMVDKERKKRLDKDGHQKPGRWW